MVHRMTIVKEKNREIPNVMNAGSTSMRIVLLASSTSTLATTTSTTRRSIV